MILYGGSHMSWENTMVLCGESHAPFGKTKGFCVAGATHPLGKHNDSVWWVPHTPWENIVILCGENVKAAPPSVKQAQHEYSSHAGKDLEGGSSKS